PVYFLLSGRLESDPGLAPVCSERERVPSMGASVYIEFPTGDASHRAAHPLRLPPLRSIAEDRRFSLNGCRAPGRSRVRCYLSRREGPEPASHTKGGSVCPLPRRDRTCRRSLPQEVTPCRSSSAPPSG